MSNYFINDLIGIFTPTKMTETITYQTSCSDQRLIEFISDYADSGRTVIHYAAKYSLMSGQCIDFLQQTYDQYLHRSMYESFSEDQRKEFEFLVNKYNLRRSKLYATPFKCQ